jgi:subtilisin family serine protease
VNLRAALSALAVALLAALLAACAAPPGLPANPQDDASMRAHPERMIVLAVANPTQGLATQAGSTLAGYTVAAPYTAGGEARSVLAAVEREHGLVELTGWPITALRLHCVVTRIPEGRSRDELLATLAGDQRVALAQPLQSFDTYGSDDSGYNDPYVDLQVGFKQLDAAEAHARSRGQGVRVAIVDTGVDTAHPDLAGRVETVRNFVDRDSAQFTSDRHGTEVAGVIAAVANNHEGIVGVAPEAHLTVLKACWQAGPQGGARCNTYTLAQALAAGIADGARIINLSLGGPPDDLLQRLVTLAVQRGRIVVGAVPPDGSLAGFPVNVPGVIAVGLPQSGQPAILQAPGRDILTLQPGGRYDFGSGSSLAAAHVSATAALLLAADPSLDAPRVRALLAASQQSAQAGGSINACAALAALRPGLPCAAAAAAAVHSP